MKKVFLTSIMLLALSFSTQAQDFSKNALGLRLGASNGFGVEISYQRGLSDKNRLELDLGFRDDNDGVDAFQLTGIYQWVWNIENGFNWYAGVGGGFGSWDNDHDHDNGNDDFDDDNDGAYIFAAGDIGIEYNFDGAPIQLSLDGRPEIAFGGGNDDFDFDIGLGIRFTF